MGDNAGCSTDISLSLTAKYAPAWGIWEGVREFVQNWLDGCQPEDSAALVAIHRAPSPSEQFQRFDAYAGATHAHAFIQF